MKYLLFALLLIFPLGQLGRVLYINDIAACIVVTVWFFSKRKNISKDPLFKPLLLFSGTMFLSLIFNLSRFPYFQILVSSLYAVRFLLYAGLYFVVKDLMQEKTTILKLLNLIVLIVAVVGLIQYIFLPDVSFLSAYDWDDHYYRLISTFLDPGFTGAILVLGLILTVVGRSRVRSLLIYIALALTYSRASYIMYLTSFATLAVYKKSAKIIIIAAIVLAVTIPLLPKSNGEGTKLQRENSITARLNNWHQSLEVWEKNPILGIGFNTYRYNAKIPDQSHSGGADNSLLLVLATTGIIGFAAYVFLLKNMWDMGNLLFKVSLAGVIIHSFFNNTLFYPFVMEWLWILLAISRKPTSQTSNSIPV